ncbi:MAG: glycosyl transferase family 2 [Clostridia bacterium BRH_c25]|nr:MAG: glycosyl transferase family 2 [Clostridia bacterium BRH_c25]
MYGRISVVVPVFNSEGSIGELYHRLSSVLACIADEYEIIMVDDGSTDNSLIEMHKLHAEERALRIICLDGNFGQQNAVMCGLRHTTGDYVITIDDDLQNPPEEIPRLLEKLEEGVDVVYGIPAVKKQSGVRKLGTAMTDLLFNIICSKPKTVKVSSFRGLKRHMVEKISADHTSFVYITAITLKHTRNIGNVRVEHEDRKYGSSNYSIYKLVKLFCRLFLNYSWPALEKYSARSPQYIIKDTGDS